MQTTNLNPKSRMHYSGFSYGNKILLGPQCPLINPPTTAKILPLSTVLKQYQLGKTKPVIPCCPASNYITLTCVFSCLFYIAHITLLCRYPFPQLSYKVFIISKWHIVDIS